MPINSAIFNFQKKICQQKITFHKELLVISILHSNIIKQAYQEVLELNYIDHLSVNIVNPNNEIVFLSSTPKTGINVCATNLWRHDQSIAPSMFTKKNFFWWDDCYAKTHYHQLKQAKEQENCLALGFVIVEKKQDFYLLYSFGSARDNRVFRKDIKEFTDYFLAKGNQCYNKVKHIYSQYSGNFAPP